MITELQQHIARFVTLSPQENDLLSSYFISHQLRKKEHLLEEGQICTSQYFIVKGCFRQYIVNEKGNEQTILFGIENWWMTDFLSFQNQSPSNFFIQAIENSEILSIEKNAMEELLEKVPKLERYFRLVMQKSFGASQIRIKYLFTMSAEERYRMINSMFPEFVQRVPQYMLASYLDFSPEFMSKIRAGKA